MSWNLTLPPRHPVAFADPIGLTAEAVAKASGAAVTATNPPIRAMTPAEREAAAWEAGYGVGAATERREWEAAGAVKGSDEPSTKASAFSWDAITAETNAEAGVNTRSES
ncbi:hypothetical protein [Methylobacterium sp. J-090]|uniref:hypothetical protein n=1 Tax=Methylobacterium sp. J-090 TaxID=2836666 RepID=UPI001FB8EA6C|nr:hypothetical protein [Methylobacterium sp. J-090]MCJ2083218.1 hypothetical protein [Methylobacterium sp. J-090]